MLTIYDRYSGDSDFFVRAANRRDKEALSDGDWGRIDALVRDLVLVVRGLAAPSFVQRTQDAIEKQAADDAAAKLLREIASRMSDNQTRRRRWWEFWK